LDDTLLDLSDGLTLKTATNGENLPADDSSNDVQLLEHQKLPEHSILSLEETYNKDSSTDAQMLEQQKMPEEPILLLDDTYNKEGAMQNVTHPVGVGIMDCRWLLFL
jgi:hypothetical protein